jgi:dTDP-4-amino-4,6-dideoxygalactose transaminase
MNTRQQLGIQVPFHRADFDEEAVQAVAEVIRSGWLTMGAKTFEFERQFAEYVGARFAIAVSSCTAALHLCLEAVGIRAGDEVLVPTTTFTATAEVITYFGARPIFVDIDSKTMNLDVRDATRRITQQTRAIIPVHFAGQPCDIDEIRDLAATNNIHAIEDAAHSLPASYKGQSVGKLSELTAFSFYATKTLSTGEGGMITTEDKSYAQRMQLMRLHGISRDAWKRYAVKNAWRYEVLENGFKYNFTDLQAALGTVQLRKCTRMARDRERIAQSYNQAFSGIESLEIPYVHSDRESAWHLYVLRLNLDRCRIDRDKFIEELGDLGVCVSVHFIPLHLQPVYQRVYGYKRGDLPQAETEYARCFSLPIYPSMTQEEVDYVISSVLDLTKKWKR